jgi:hypothetical protein
MITNQERTNHTDNRGRLSLDGDDISVTQMAELSADAEMKAVEQSKGVALPAAASLADKLGLSLPIDPPNFGSIPYNELLDDAASLAIAWGLGFDD